MNFVKVLISAAAALVVSMPAHASFVTLPTANAMSTGDKYGDFTVYSLDLLAQCQPVDVRCQPYQGDKTGEQLVVNSQSLSDQMIVYRNENGQPTSNYVQGPLAGGTIATAGVDNPFDAPTGSPLTYDMATTNEALGEVAGATGCTADFAADKCGTWEAKLSTVQDYIKGNAVVFLFDNNQQGGSVAQQQFFWATLQILDAAGNPVAGLCYELTAGTSNCALNPSFTDIANPGEFVGSGGGICVDAVTGAGYLVGPTGTDHPTSSGQCQGVAGHPATGNYFVNNNLGQSSAEFAVTLDALNANLANWAAAGYSMSINFKMRNLNDGGEELWICSNCSIGEAPPPELPEPGSLALAALALLTLGVAKRRRS